MFGVELEQNSTISNVKVYVDECDNIDNIYEDGDDKHNYVFDQDDCTITKITDKWYVIVINDASIEVMNNHLKYVRFISDEAVIDSIYYDSSTIYNAELTHLKKVCSTCLDDACMQMITYVTFKRQLLDSAVNTVDAKNAMQLYIDICKLLDLDTVSKCETNCCANGRCCIK